MTLNETNSRTPTCRSGLRGSIDRRLVTARAHPDCEARSEGARIAPSRAGVTQLAECLLPKQDVAGSSPVSRSTFSVTAPR